MNRHLCASILLILLLMPSGCRLRFRPEAWNAPAAAGDVPALRRILDGGVSVNAQDENGDTMLTYALTYRRWEAAKFLLDRGADPEFRSNVGHSVVETAVSNLGDDQTIATWVEKNRLKPY